MTVLTQPLRDEHAEILPHIDELREVADAVGQRSPDAAMFEALHAAHESLEEATDQA